MNINRPAAQVAATDKNLAASMRFAMADELSRLGGVPEGASSAEKKAIFSQIQSAAANRVASDYRLTSDEQVRFLDAFDKSGGPLKDALDLAWTAVDSRDGTKLWPGMDRAREAMRDASRLAGVSEDEAREHTHVAFLAFDAGVLSAPENRAIANQLVDTLKRQPDMTSGEYQLAFSKAHIQAGLKHEQALAHLASKAERGEPLPEGLDADRIDVLQHSARGFTDFLTAECYRAVETRQMELMEEMAAMDRRGQTKGPEREALSEKVQETMRIKSSLSDIIRHVPAAKESLGRMPPIDRAARP